MIRFIPLPAHAADFSGLIARHTGDAQFPYKAADGRELLISLFRPPHFDPAERHPLLVWIHGGGWNSRKIFPDQADWAGDQLGFLARRYADRGYLCACIDYRLMRNDGQDAGYELFDLYEDCADGVDALLNRADAWGIDRQRVVVLGESAGGYLAAALTTLPWRDRTCYRGAVLINAITDLTEPLWQRCVPQHSARTELAGCTLAEKTLLLSPVQHISGDTCPTLLLHGAADTVVLPYHAQKLYDLLRARGGKADLHWIADTDHAFMLAEYMQELHTPLHALTASLPGLDEWLDALMAEQHE